MSYHIAIAPGRVAVITGAASGIGLATAERLAGLGMKLVLADIDADAVKNAGVELGRSHPGAEILAVPTDVANAESVEALQSQTRDRFGEVDFLMCNAGVEAGGKGVLSDPERWRKILDVNLWGTIHPLQAFLPAMVERGRAGAIVITGSKQGITAPPGNTAYNVSKAAVKMLAESLAHELRNIEGCRLSVHLLIPGFTYTGLAKARGVKEKPEGAWTGAQVVDFMIEGMASGDFYILCPDNETTRGMDEKRMRWAADDIIENRPALSRWHPDYKDAFAAFMKS